MADLPSPIDGVPMRKVRRYGIEMDVCTRTGGIWLDHGELERVLDTVRRDAEDLGRREGRRSARRDELAGFDSFDDSDGDARAARRRRRLSLSDLFD